MLACLLAALMSSVDAYMLVGSALVVRNIYSAYFNANASEKQYITAARITGAVIVFGAAAISLFMMDVFKQLQLTWVFPVFVCGSVLARDVLATGNQISGLDIDRLLRVYLFPDSVLCASNLSAASDQR